MGVDDTTHFATTVSAGIFDKQLVHNFTWGSPGVWCGKKKQLLIVCNNVQQSNERG